jgi:hypothetical protein
MRRPDTILLTIKRIEPPLQEGTRVACLMPTDRGDKPEAACVQRK